MEKHFKIVASIFAVALYCLTASGFSDNNNQKVKVDQNTATTGSPIFVAEEIPYLYGFALKEGFSFSSAGNTNQISIKQQKQQKAVLHALEVEVACAVLQYISQLQNNPVRIRKSDMLFPFHYFFEINRAY